uniref:Ig-like domain-containing protein n=1 Tax=Hucho hucho TaxID=62062 RepID=A0A4W5MTI7_9TELE
HFSHAFSWIFLLLFYVHVTGVFSEDCVLPCSFQHGSDEVIHWLKPEDKDLTVHSYYYSRDQLKQQSQPYRGRTALLNDQIPKGNASLLLRGLTLQDQGRYKCYTSTINGNKKSFINIAVEGMECLSLYDIITCSSTGIYPEPKLTWSTDPPSDLSFDPGTIQNSTSIKLDDRGLYDITSTKQFCRDQTNICTHICLSHFLPEIQPWLIAASPQWDWKRRRLSHRSSDLALPHYFLSHCSLNPEESPPSKSSPTPDSAGPVVRCP